MSHKKGERDNMSMSRKKDVPPLPSIEEKGTLPRITFPSFS
ncbi:hypothetical protein HMPREF1869_00620 [Bacteroidales bacterium KA00251]|nr:hypothetical protein HMPREF1869_00620 [Bacteroidales bacterium KA00251]